MTVPPKYQGLWPIKRTGNADNERAQINRLFEKIIVSVDEPGSSRKVNWGDIEGNIVDQKDLNELQQEIIHNDTTEKQGGTDNEYYHLTETEHTRATTFLDGGTDTHTEIEAEVDTNKNALNTGVLSGGSLSVNGTDNTKFDVGAGVGLIVDHSTSPSTVTTVSWDAFTSVTVDALNTDTSTDIAIDSNGAIVQQKSFTNSELRSLIFLGGLDHSGSTVINNTFDVQVPSFDPGLAVRDLADAVGDINITGNGIFANGADMRIKKTAGDTFSFGRNTTSDITDPHIITTAEQAPVSFRYIFSDGAGGTSVGSETELIDPTVYDDGSGTLQTVANNHWVAQRVLFFPNSENVFIQHSQDEYNKKADALDAISFAAFDELPGFGTAITLAIIIVKKEATDLSDSATTQFVDVGKFGDVTSIGVQEVVWGDITGTLSNQTDLQTALDGKSDTSHTHTLADVTDSGTAAAADLTTSNTDTTAGRVTTVGFAGLGGAAILDSGVTEATPANRCRFYYGSIGGDLGQCHHIEVGRAAGSGSETGFRLFVARDSDLVRLVRASGGVAAAPVDLWHTGNLESANLDWTGTHTFANPISFTGKSGTLDYDEDTVTLGGDFDASQQVKCVRVGSQVTITGLGALGHSGSFGTASSAVGDIPSQYRPTSEASNVFYSINRHITVSISDNGTLSVEHRDFSGTITGDTSTAVSPTISYNIT